MQELAQLRGAKGEQRSLRPAPLRNPNIVCWNCRHIQRYCRESSAAFKLLRAGGAGQPSAKQLETFCICGECGNSLNSDGGGRIKDHVTTMLVDTGSAVTVVRADLWERSHPIELKPPNQPVVVADGNS